MNHILNSVAISLTITILFSGAMITFAQNSTQNATHVQISKISSSNTIISNGTSSVSSFGTMYTITGFSEDIKNSKDLITSTILDDFTNSSTIGYVKLSDSNPNSDQQQIANPFASNEQIEQKITELLNKATQETSDDGIVSITCNFGNNLDLFACSY